MRGKTCGKAANVREQAGVGLASTAACSAEVRQAFCRNESGRAQPPPSDSQERICSCASVAGAGGPRTSALGRWGRLPLPALTVRHFALRRPQPGQARFKLLVRLSLLPIRPFPSHHNVRSLRHWKQTDVGRWVRSVPAPAALTATTHRLPCAGRKACARACANRLLWQCAYLKASVRAPTAEWPCRWSAIWRTGGRQSV